MKIAVCDSERATREKWEGLIRGQRADAEVFSFASGRQLLEARQRFQIVLMDIRPESGSGIEIARALRMKDEAVILIFITASKEYAFEAFDVSAFQYLLKPVSEERFRQVLERACGEAERRAQERQEQLFLRTKSRTFTVAKGEILYVESQGRKVDIHTVRDCITIYGTMAGMEEQLGKDFCRCHRGYLVNLARVAGYEPGRVLLENGEAVFMAREKYTEFDRSYRRYRQGEGQADG
ncbi:MAG: LytTR family DNA-binding domain-containing protein [Roseburia sp.]|nr:LytTR family DNA-binding domain-containing protein [Roseburia sp.]MCM1098563.1 LytTR family DNA-binding domain-containing protein [Ruminococcus flavefaciens]